MPNINDFLKPESAVTSGAAGGVIMTVASTLYAQFEIDPRICALVMSALISFAIIYKIKEQLPLKMVYLLVNTVVIFSVSVGSNTLVSKSTNEPIAFSLPDIIPSAHAHDTGNEHTQESHAADLDTSSQTAEEMQKTIEQLQKKQAELELQLKQKSAEPKHKKRSFTDSWY